MNARYRGVNLARLDAGCRFHRFFLRVDELRASGRANDGIQCRRNHSAMVSYYPYHRGRSSGLNGMNARYGGVDVTCFNTGRCLHRLFLRVEIRARQSDHPSPSPSAAAPPNQPSVR
jgi:hypothetical protein